MRQLWIIYGTLALGSLTLLFIFAIFVLSIIEPFGNIFERSPMNQELVERCFEKNFEDLETVAQYLKNVEHDDFNVFVDSDLRKAYMNFNYNDDIWRDEEDIVFEITDPKVARAIERLERIDYWINRRGNTIYFQREGRGQFSRYGRFQTGVAYLIDGSDLSIISLHSIIISLSRSNWYFYLEGCRLENVLEEHPYLVGIESS